jgi:peptide/nickel transport system substrate-binding protein
MRKLYVLLIVILTVSLVLTASPLFAGRRPPEEKEEEVKTAPAEKEEPAPEPEYMGKEAPMLAEMVKAGKLPPLEERLPENPLVIEPFEEIGKYSDTFRRGTGFFMPDEWLISHHTNESFFAFTWPIPGDGPILPNLAESWEFANDGKELTIHLRKGTKWSDGEPFTVDDILFFLYDILEDEQAAYTWYHTDNLYYEGELPKIDKIDDYTLKFTYPDSFYFAETAYSCLSEIAMPKHYMKQFHPKYNPDATYELLNEKIPWFSGRGAVTLQPWMLESFDPDSKMVIVRNPYYWKVDPAGQQLPYFDKCEIFAAGDRQGVALGNVTGEYDLDNMWVGIQHLSLFLEEEDKRDFSIGHSILSSMGIFFGYDGPDADARKVVRNTDFRRAVSLAINRPEIGRVLFYDQLVPMGCSFSPVSPYFEESVGKLYSEYDPERAKKILDDAGIIDRDGDGIRELPTGEKCEVIWDVYEHDLYSPLSEMVVEDIAKVGIKFVLNIQHQLLVTERLEAGNFEASTYDFSAHVEPLAALEWWIPITPGTPKWHPKAYQSPFSPEYEEFIELLQKAKNIPYDERVATLKKANKIMAENVFVIHIGFYKRPNIVSNRLGNAPKVVGRIDEFGSAGPEWMYYQIFEKYKPGEKP